MANIVVRCKVCGSLIFVVDVSVIQSITALLLGPWKDPTMWIEPHVCPTRVKWPDVAIDQQSGKAPPQGVLGTSEANDPVQIRIREALPG